MDFPTKTYIDSKLGDVSGVKDVMNPANERDGTGPTVNILARDLTNAQYAGATQRGAKFKSTVLNMTLIWRAAGSGGRVSGMIVLR
jgi:hypothetical protein